MASIDKRPNGTYRARWREVPGGPQRTKHFDRKLDAQRFLVEIEGLVVGGFSEVSGIQTEIETGGLDVATSTSRGDPARAIMKTSKNIKADLIVLATHGKKGSRPFWEGSVTPKISRSSKTPLLLIPVRE